MLGLSNEILMGLAFGIFIGLVLGNKPFRTMVLRFLDGLMKSGKSNQSKTTKRVCPHCHKPLE